MKIRSHRSCSSDNCNYSFVRRRCIIARGLVSRAFPSCLEFRVAEFLRAQCRAVIKREAENVKKMRGFLIEHRSREC